MSITSTEIDLVLIGDDLVQPPEWKHGKIHLVRGTEKEILTKLNQTILSSNAELVFIWGRPGNIPTIEPALNRIAKGTDLVHAGLRSGTGSIFPDLMLIKQDWSMINAADNLTSTNWRISLDACIFKTDHYRRLRGVDPVFETLGAAGLDLGLRWMQAGGLITYSPDISPEKLSDCRDLPADQDFYSFVIRHYGVQWAGYAATRRILAKPLRFVSQLSNLKKALDESKKHTALMDYGLNLSAGSSGPGPNTANNVSISVIVPTIGRYAFLKDALDSLREQTLKPSEVIVIDQNYPESRDPGLYKQYEDLNLKVIWQDERGQSLARNTGVSKAQGEYIFLFDDDSIAAPDLIARHYSSLRAGKFDVSTGVAFPPPPEKYQLPVGFTHQRIAQTLDTGNCMLLRNLYLQVGGLDRNYDYGPGTDADFGTRLYLDGYKILHNPDARRVHYKAPIGGLRIHGSKKYNTDDGLLSPYPKVTQSYYSLRYWTNRGAQERSWLQYVTSKFPRRSANAAGFRSRVDIRSIIKFLLLVFLYPIKHRKSFAAARDMIDSGPKFMAIKDHAR